MNNAFKLLLIAAGFYLGHNALNGLLYGFDLILVITLVPYAVVAILWKKMHRILKACLLVLLGAVEIPMVTDNFNGFQIESLSGVFLLAAILMMLVNAVMLIVNNPVGVKERTL